MRPDSRTSLTGLAAALRSAQKRKERAPEGDWVIVREALRRHAHAQRCGSYVDDVVQDAVIAVLRRAPFVGKLDGQAGAYLRPIVYHAYLEIVDPSRRLDPMRHLDHGASDGLHPLDREGESDEDVDVLKHPQGPELVAAQLERLHAYIDEVVDDAMLSAVDHDSALRKARARVMARVDRIGNAEIAERLGVPDTKPDTVAQWTRRGRAWIEKALDRWQSDATEDERLVVVSLRGDLLSERADAGKSRPARRASTGGKAKPARKKKAARKKPSKKKKATKKPPTKRGGPR